MSTNFERREAIDPELPGVWRYLPLLGTSAATAQRLADVRGPELRSPIEAPDLARELGVASLRLLRCDGGPSGTFKDAEAAVVFGRLIDRRGSHERVVFCSSGNTARAYRAYALAAGIESTAVIPEAGLEKLRGVTPDPRSRIIAVEGGVPAAARSAREHAEPEGSRLLAPIEWRLDGKAAIAYAIAEHVPEATVVAQTIAGGFGPLGMERGFARMQRLGLCDRPPRFELFQPEGQASLARWLEVRGPISAGDLQLPEDPFEPTLQSVGPLTTAPEIGRLVDRGHASVEVVEQASVEREAAALSEAAGEAISYRDERSPFVGWAGLLQRRDALERSDHVVLVLSGARARVGELPPVESAGPPYDPRPLSNASR